jgi:MFS superfamily sulfate permease-like transporter
LGTEVLAGITLLAIALPLNIGYAQIAGLPPSAGLYALVLPSVVFALLASSRHLVAAPDAAAAALVGSALAGLAPAGRGVRPRRFPGPHSCGRREIHPHWRSTGT